ncbi:hypothetical protein AWENTII_012135 [Aspergillus wentii]
MSSKQHGSLGMVGRMGYTHPKTIIRLLPLHRAPSIICGNGTSPFLLGALDSFLASPVVSVSPDTSWLPPSLNP